MRGEARIQKQEKIRRRRSIERKRWCWVDHTSNLRVPPGLCVPAPTDHSLSSSPLTFRHFPWSIGCFLLPPGLPYLAQYRGRLHLSQSVLFFSYCCRVLMGITRGKWHKRLRTGAIRRRPHSKRRHELGRPSSHTRLGEPRVRPIRVRGGNFKQRALRLNAGSYSWPSQAIARRTQIHALVYHPTSNEFVRQNALTKSGIVEIDATPFIQWFYDHYGINLGQSKLVCPAALFGSTFQNICSSFLLEWFVCPHVGAQTHGSVCRPVISWAWRLCRGSPATAEQSHPDAPPRPPCPPSCPYFSLPGSWLMEGTFDIVRAIICFCLSHLPLLCERIVLCGPEWLSSPILFTCLGLFPQTHGHSYCFVLSLSLCVGVWAGCAWEPGALQTHEADSGTPKERATRTGMPTAKIDDMLKTSLETGRILAKITTRPGQVGVADGYILEGEELHFYARRVRTRKGKGT